MAFLPNENGDSLITSVCERKSVLKRPYATDHSMDNGKEQVMVANVDYVFIVSSLNDNYNFNRIARYVSMTLQGNAIPVVILTKADLCSNPGRYASEIENLSEQVKVHCVSALYGIGMDELNKYLRPGKTIAILGSSGVGKVNLSECTGTGRCDEDFRNPGERRKRATYYNTQTDDRAFKWCKNH